MTRPHHSGIVVACCYKPRTNLVKALSSIRSAHFRRRHAVSLRSHPWLMFPTELEGAGQVTSTVRICPTRRHCCCCCLFTNTKAPTHPPPPATQTDRSFPYSRHLAMLFSIRTRSTWPSGGTLEIQRAWAGQPPRRRQDPWATVRFVPGSLWLFLSFFASFCLPWRLFRSSFEGWLEPGDWLCRPWLTPDFSMDDAPSGM